MKKTAKTLLTPIKIFIIVAMLLPALVTPSSATPVTWTLFARFDDGAVATGTFQYDSLTNAYSSISIQTTSSSVQDGWTYLGPANPTIDPNQLDLSAVQPPATAPTYYHLYLAFANPLTTAGGSINITKQSYEEETYPTNGFDAVRDVTTGSVYGAPVPEPSALLQIGLGLAVLGVLRRKKFKCI
jgi:hypothetical protein